MDPAKSLGFDGGWSLASQELTFPDMRKMLDHNGTLIEEEYLEWLDLHATQAVALLAGFFLAKSIRHKGWPFEEYYSALHNQALVIYLALRGLDEM